MEKLLGFAPDADPTMPGVLTDCTNFIPYEGGMKGCPTGVTPSGVPALAAACQGVAVVTKLDDTRRIIAGTSAKLYELLSGAWSDLSAVGGYSGSADTRWQFAQFGNTTLAANQANVIQSSTGAAFAAIATAPQARVIFTVGSFVMALNTIDGTYGTQPDRWWCSATYDETSWTPSLSTLATTGRLVSTPGQIVAGGRLGEYAVAYKERAIYIGQFVGAPAVWDWLQVTGGEAGCVGLEAWCDIGGAHFIIGQDNIWLFDGSRPQPVGVGQVRQWFYQNSNPSYRYLTKCIFDKQNNVVWVFYPGMGSTACDSVMVYHVQTKQWGLATQTIEAVANYISAGVTIDGLDAVSATIDGLSNSFDSQFWLSGGRALSTVNSSHQLQLITGSAATSSFTTGDYGDDDRVSLLNKIRIRFAPNYQPTGSASTYRKMTEGDALTTGSTAVMNDSKFDVLQSARWHSASFTFTGDSRVLGIGFSLTAQGSA